MKKNGGNLLDLNSSKADQKLTLNSIFSQNTILTKQLQSAESNKHNITSLYSTMVNLSEESKKRDTLLMDMLQSMKADYQCIIAQKVIDDKELKHVQYSEQDYQMFFEEDNFQKYFKKYLEKNHTVLKYWYNINNCYLM